MVYLVVHMLSIFHSYNRWYHLHKDVQQRQKKWRQGEQLDSFLALVFIPSWLCLFYWERWEHSYLQDCLEERAQSEVETSFEEFGKQRLRLLHGLTPGLGWTVGRGCVFRSCDISVGLQDLCADVLLLFPKGPSVNKRAGSVARQVTVRLLSWIWGWCLVAGKPLQPTCHEIIIMCLFCLTETWEGVQYIG